MTTAARRNRRLLLLAALAVVPLASTMTSNTLLAADTATPERVREARDNYDRGLQALRAEEFERALKLFQTADDIMGVPSTRSRVADALAGLGRLVEARDAARSVSNIPVAENENEVQAAARQRATALIQSLKSRIAIVSIEAPAGGLTRVLIDGEVVVVDEYGAVAVDPGTHELRFEAAGQEPVVQALTLAEGEVKTVSPDIAGGSGDGVTVGALTWTGIGLAGAGIVVGVVAGAITLSRTSEIEELCTAGDGNDCPPEHHGLRGDALTAAHTSTAGLAVAGAGATLALISFLAIDLNGASAEDDELALLPIVGPQFVGLRGTF